MKAIKKLQYDHISEGKPWPLAQMKVVVNGCCHFFISHIKNEEI